MIHKYRQEQRDLPTLFQRIARKHDFSDPHCTSTSTLGLKSSPGSGQRSHSPSKFQENIQQMLRVKEIIKDGKANRIQNRDLGGTIRVYISRKETCNLQENQRSPNKLNATRKPMISPIRGGTRQAINPNTTAHNSNYNQTHDRISAFKNLSQRNQQPDTLKFNIGKPEYKSPFSNNSGQFQTTQYNISSNRATTHNIFNGRCVNHTEKTAQFMIRTDEENIQYCHKCATMAASQGFDVLPIGDKRGLTSNERNNMVRPIMDTNMRAVRFQQRRPIRILPQNPSLQSHRSYKEIVSLLSELFEVQSLLYRNLDSCSQLSRNLQSITINTQKFYEQLFHTVRRMHQEHMQDLKKECDKVSQQLLIEEDLLKQNIEQIDSIREDIEGNLEQIVMKVDRRSFQKCVEFYRQKVGVARVEGEQVRDRVKSKWMPSLDTTQVRQKIEIAINALKGLWFQYSNNGVSSDEPSNSSRQNSSRNPSKSQKGKPMLSGNSYSNPILIPSNTKFNQNQYSSGNRAFRTSQQIDSPRITISPPVNRQVAYQSEGFVQQERFNRNGHYEIQGGNNSSHNNNYRQQNFNRHFNSINQQATNFFSKNREPEKRTDDEGRFNRDHYNPNPRSSHHSNHYTQEESDNKAFRALFVEELPMSPQFKDV